MDCRGKTGMGYIHYTTFKNCIGLSLKFVQVRMRMHTHTQKLYHFPSVGYTFSLTRPQLLEHTNMQHARRASWRARLCILRRDSYTALKDLRVSSWLLEPFRGISSVLPPSFWSCWSMFPLCLLYDWVWLIDQCCACSHSASILTVLHTS